MSKIINTPVCIESYNCFTDKWKALMYMEFFLILLMMTWLFGLSISVNKLFEKKFWELTWLREWVVQLCNNGKDVKKHKLALGK